MATSAATNKRWGRRVGTAITWAVLAYGSTTLQPTLNLDPDILKLVIQTSREVALILILGLSATDWVKLRGGKNGNR